MISQNLIYLVPLQFFLSFTIMTTGTDKQYDKDEIARNGKSKRSME